MDERITSDDDDQEEVVSGRSQQPLPQDVEDTEQESSGWMADLLEASFSQKVKQAMEATLLPRATYIQAHVKDLQDDGAQVTAQATADRDKVLAELHRLTELLAGFQQRIQSFLPLQTPVQAEDDSGTINRSA